MRIDEDRFDLFMRNIRRQLGPGPIVSENRLREMVKNAEYPEQVRWTPRGGTTVEY